MKTYLFYFLSFFFIASSAFSQTSCSKYYPLTDGRTFEIQIFDKKDKLSGTTKYEVKNVTANAAVMNAAFYDKKNKEVFTSEYEVLCKDDGISIDFKSLMNGDFMKQYKDMQIDMTGTNLDLPNNLKTGQTLPDATMHAVINMAPMKVKMDISMVNRKVAANETITTPAGTFDCVVISYTTEFKMGMRRTGTSKQWLAEGVGLVKSEEYNKKGNRISYSILSKIN